MYLQIGDEVSVTVRGWTKRGNRQVTGRTVTGQVAAPPCSQAVFIQFDDGERGHYYLDDVKKLHKK